jgi:protein involved in polysaccharide export with SLBB domain
VLKSLGSVLLLIGLFVPTLSSALAPSAAQVQMLQSLPESEKQDLIESYAGGSAATVNQKPEEEVETVTKIVAPETPVVPAETTVLGEDSDNMNASLKPFGAFLFAGKPTTFAPVNDIPVPTDYILGPGDQLKVHLFGSKNESYEVVVDRNGQISLPSLGPVNLAGMRFSEAKAFLLKKLKTLGVGVNASITMGALRSFRIFVLGESRTPGSYLVSGMATITHALYVSGGLTEIGSFRNVQLKRQGRLIKTLDLYDLLLKGDTANDVRLQPGDTVFIPKLSKQVAVSGAVLKPALYELKNEKNMADLLKVVGGFTANAYQKSVQLSRITTAEAREVLSLDLTQNKGLNYKVKNGDEITVPLVTASQNSLITLSGPVAHAGLFAWHSNLKLLDLLPSRSYFSNDADLSLLFIKRQTKIAGTYEILKANWLQALTDVTGAQNIALLPRDEVIVLSIVNPEQRQSKISGLLSLMQQQASQSSPLKRVTVNGGVKYPGNYPLVKDMHVVDLLQMSGALNPSAMMDEAEIIRYAVVEGQRREVETIAFTLKKALAGDLQHNVLLQPYDSLMIKHVSDWSDAAQMVVIKGEVSYPGSYVIKPGDTLESVLLRAGGFSQWAAPQNTVFTRSALKLQERREMDAMADELEKGLLFSIKTDAAILEKGAGATIATMGQALVEKVKQTPALGRLVIGLNPENESRYQATMQLELRDGDELIIPKRTNEIVVMGEVSRPASLLYQAGISTSDYLEQSGGLTKRADADSIYIVRGDGSIIKYQSGFFDSDDDIALQAGDAIIVPMDVERVSPMVTWTSVSKVLANLAITAATFKTIGVFE